MRVAVGVEAPLSESRHLSLVILLLGDSCERAKFCPLLGITPYWYSFPGIGFSLANRRCPQLLFSVRSWRSAFRRCTVMTSSKYFVQRRSTTTEGRETAPPHTFNATQTRRSWDGAAVGTQGQQLLMPDGNGWRGQVRLVRTLLPAQRYQLPKSWSLRYLPAPSDWRLLQTLLSTRQHGTAPVTRLLV